MSKLSQLGIQMALKFYGTKRKQLTVNMDGYKAYYEQIGSK